MPDYKNLEIKSFLDSNGNILQNLINNIGDNNPMECAEILTRPKIENPDPKNPKKKIKDYPIEKNQIRKFYDSFLKIYNAQVDEETKKIMLLMQKAHTEYSEKRLNITRFRIFYLNRIDIVVSKSGDEFKKNMNALKLNFEALIGYFPK